MIHEPRALDSLLRKIPLFAHLPEETYRALCNAVVRRRFTRHQVILQEADTPHYLYVVLSGRVKVVQISEEGNESILAMHKRGESFGEMALLDGRTAPASVIALEDAEIGFLAKADFDRCCLKDPAALRDIIGILCAQLREAWLTVRVTRLADAEQRVRVVLGHLGGRFGVAHQGGVLLNVRLTHQEIAELASTSRETASRFLNRFVRDGEVAVQDKKFLILLPPFTKKMPIL